VAFISIQKHSWYICVTNSIARLMRYTCVHVEFKYTKGISIHSLISWKDSLITAYAIINKYTSGNSSSIVNDPHITCEMDNVNFTK